MVTTRPKCSKKLFTVVADIMQMIPNVFYYPRGFLHLRYFYNTCVFISLHFATGTYEVNDMAQFAISRSFTHLFVLLEKDKVCNGLLVTHLPVGPTAFFRLSSFCTGSKIEGHGKPTSHIPEIILNNFSTRLGRRVGRFLGSFFPHEPQFEGRQVVTFHNQRDFIFVRHHRYIYRKESAKVRARLQELGPRFTLKLKWLQEGMFDTQFGEYEWIHKRNQITNRKKFNL